MRKGTIYNFKIKPTKIFKIAPQNILRKDGVSSQFLLLNYVAIDAVENSSNPAPFVNIMRILIDMKNAQVKK